MTPTPWILEIVHVSSAQKQQDLLVLLREVASVTALGSWDDSGPVVIYDCPDQRLKATIDKLFAEVDPEAAPVQCIRQPIEPNGDGAA